MRQWILKILKTNAVRQFHKTYYGLHPEVWKNTYWLGHKVLKCPLDLWIYQEIIFEVKPDIIIECGTMYGASALFFASCCDLVNNGIVISIDIQPQEKRPEHNRITYLHGSSTSQEIINQLQGLLKGKVLVILDSLHTKQHVLEELNIYSKMVTSGSYIIVEDTNVGGHPVKKSLYPGAMEAVIDFIASNTNFIIDKTKEKFLLTFNPNGYLKKILN
ncbi:MAG: CmcI family methyltransferase [Planctomycetota bacterium]|jgi:cephalosporin hydroxylase